MLALPAVSDLVIAGAMAAGHGAQVPVIVDLATSLVLMGLGLLALAAERMQGSPVHDDEASPSEDTIFRPSEDDQALSSAVNRMTGDNISRYVNARRVEAA